MKRNTPNSQDKNRSDNNSRNKNGRDSKATSKNASNECINNKCKAANSCTSATKTVDDIERYTREAESLVEALSALTKLAEQLKPCITTNTSQPAFDVNSDISYTDEDVVQSDDDDDEEANSEPNIPAVTKRPAPKSVPKVRSEPARVKPTAENPEPCVCYCSSLHQNKISFKDDKPNKEKTYDEDEDEKSRCCSRRPSKEKQKNTVKDAPQKPAKERSPKVVEEIIQFKPLPMPVMTVVQPVEDPKVLRLEPVLIYNNPIENKPITIYPVVAATTTKAALNLDDKEMQTATENRMEMGSMTDPVQFADGNKTKGCATCCPEDCKVDMAADGGATTLDAIPFEEYAEKDCFQYWYDDVVHCKCPPSTDIDSKHAPPAQYQPPSLSSTPVEPETERQPTSSAPSQQQQQQSIPYPTNMNEYYLNYPGNQQNPQPGLEHQQIPQEIAHPNYAGSTNLDPKGPGTTKPIYNDHTSTGINGVNYLPPERIIYKACRAKGPTIDPKTQVIEEIECIPICKNTEPQNRSYAAGPSSLANRTPPNAYQNRPQPNNKKMVQYENQQYQYYSGKPQRNYEIQQEIQYNIDLYPPCYENTPQKSRVTGRPQESNSSNRNVSFGQPTTGCQQKQLNNLIGRNYKTLFVDKPDKEMEKRIKKI